MVCIEELTFVQDRRAFNVALVLVIRTWQDRGGDKSCEEEQREEGLHYGLVLVEGLGRCWIRCDRSLVLERGKK